LSFGGLSLNLGFSIFIVKGRAMKKFTHLLLSLIFISGSALAAETAAPSENNEPQAHEQEHGKRQNDFYPRKKADKSLASRPGQVELLEPKALSEISGAQVTLKWKPVEGAESYRLQVATDPNFKWLVTQEDFFKGTSYDLKGLEAGKHYFWRVFAWRPQNDASWSSSFANLSSFETK
jgi:hypothetical protein